MILFCVTNNNIREKQCNRPREKNAVDDKNNRFYRKICDKKETLHCLGHL